MEQSLINAVSTVGFPIAMCGAFGYILVYVIKKMLTQIDAFGVSLDNVWYQNGFTIDGLINLCALVIIYREQIKDNSQLF